MSGCQCTCESPWSFPAEPDTQGCFQGGSQLAEVPNLSTGKPPLFPVTHTHSASEPVKRNVEPKRFRETWKPFLQDVIWVIKQSVSLNSVL